MYANNGFIFPKMKPLSIILIKEHVRYIHAFYGAIIDKFVITFKTHYGNIINSCSSRA